MSNFKERYLNDEVTIDELDDFVEQWHTSSNAGSLQDFLGFTDTEAEAFAHGETRIKKMLDDLKQHKLASTLKKAFAKIVKQD